MIYALVSCQSRQAFYNDCCCPSRHPTPDAWGGPPSTCQRESSMHQFEDRFASRFASFFSSFSPAPEQKKNVKNIRPRTCTKFLLPFSCRLRPLFPKGILPFSSTGKTPCFPGKSYYSYRNFSMKPLFSPTPQGPKS